MSLIYRIVIFSERLRIARDYRRRSQRRQDLEWFLARSFVRLAFRNLVLGEGK